MRAQLACLRTVTPPSEGLPIGSPTPSACFSASASTPTEVGPTPTTSKTSPMPTTALKPSRCASRRPAVKPSGRETREALDSRWPPAFRFPSRCSRHASGRRHPAATGQSRPNRAVPKPVPLSRRTGPVPRGTHTPTHTTHPARHTIAPGGMAGRRLLTTLRVRLTAEDTVDNSRRSPLSPKMHFRPGGMGDAQHDRFSRLPRRPPACGLSTDLGRSVSREKSQGRPVRDRPPPALSPIQGGRSRTGAQPWAARRVKRRNVARPRTRGPGPLMRYLVAGAGLNPRPSSL